MFPYIHIVLPFYTVMALLGGFAAICFLFFRLERFQIPFVLFLKYLLLCAVGGYVGSKLLFALTQIPELVRNFSLEDLLMLVPRSGLVFYGGLFGVIFTLLLLTRRDRELRDRVFRMAVPAMPLFHAFGRIGCFLTGCCYGKPLSTAWNVGPVVFNRVPVQLMEAAAELILFAVTLLADRRREEIDLLRLYLVLYAAVRFADEFLRGDEIRGIFFGLSTAQWISLAIISFYLLRWIANIRQKNGLDANFE